MSLRQDNESDEEILLSSEIPGYLNLNSSLFRDTNPANYEQRVQIAHEIYPNIPLNILYKLSNKDLAWLSRGHSLQLQNLKTKKLTDEEILTFFDNVGYSVDDERRVGILQKYIEGADEHEVHSFFREHEYHESLVLLAHNKWRSIPIEIFKKLNTKVLNHIINGDKLQKYILEACGLNSEEIKELDEFISKPKSHEYHQLLKQEGFELTPDQVDKLSATQMYHLSRGAYGNDMGLTREQQVHADIISNRKKRQRKADSLIGKIKSEFPFYEESVLQKLNPNELARLRRGENVNVDRYASMLSPQEIEQMRQHVSTAFLQHKTAKF